MSYLQLQRAVAESPAAFDAFAAAYAKWFVDGIFEEGVFDEFTTDGVRGAELVFGGSIEGFGAGFEISTTEVAVTAHGEDMRTLDGRRAHHTFGGTASALNAFTRVELPYHLSRSNGLG